MLVLFQVTRDHGGVMERLDCRDRMVRLDQPDPEGQRAQMASLDHQVNPDRKGRLDHRGPVDLQVCRRFTISIRKF